MMKEGMSVRLLIYVYIAKQIITSVDRIESRVLFSSRRSARPPLGTSQMHFVVALVIGGRQHVCK